MSDAAEPTVAEVEMTSCEDCGEGPFKGPQGLVAHQNLWCDASETGRATKELRGSVPKQSKRGMTRRGFSTHVPTEMEQIRPRPGGPAGGPAAYFINPTGATIREILLIYPNGAPVIHNGVDRANSAYFQKRQADKGYEYVGPNLTPDGVRRLVDILQLNNADLLLDLNEQIEDAQEVLKQSDLPAVREQARRRMTQLTRLLETAKTPFDADKVIGELNDIAKAQKLSALSPAMREAITLMVGDQTDEKINRLVTQMAGGKVSSMSDGGVTTPVTVTNAQDDEEF